VIQRLTNPPLHASLADVPEADLVRRLVADPHWRSSVFNIMGMPDAPRILQLVDLRDAPGAFAGDADIILVAPDQPSVATAIEVKRIKAGASAFASGRPNKLREYEKAVKQVNRLGEVGFAQVYLYVIVVVDSRVNNDGRYTYDGLTSELRAAIDARVSLAHLESSVGLVVHEFVQPMDHPPLELGTYGGSLKRLATPRPQAAKVTEWLGRLLEHDAA
jgi:hypothetical protein